MRAIEHAVTSSPTTTTYEKWARGAFLAYLFFAFFGTSAPFPGLESAPSEISTSNYVNQSLSLLFLVSLLSLVGKHEQVVAFVRREKILTLFLGWCLLSIVWSPYPVVSLKRWFTLFGEVIICLAALLHYRWSEEALRPIRTILFAYIPLSLLAVLFVHEATQWEFPAWRGLAPTKNNLGQITLFSLILWLGIIPYHRGKAINVVHYVLLVATAVLFIGARSTTSMLTGGVLLGILGAQYAGVWLKQPLIARFYTGVLLLGAVSIGVMVVYGAPELLESFLAFFGKDLSFTGRVDLWQVVLAMTEGKWLLGWGLGAFWVMSSPHLAPLFEAFPWVPNQAHQGYIDIISQTGLIGLFLLIAMIVAYFKRLGSLEKRQIWKWLMLSLLVLNFQESLFFRPRHLGHFLFIFSYLALHVDLIKEHERAHLRGGL